MRRRGILSDGTVALTLANAAHVKNVPGRKNDTNDATSLADLLAHGLVRGSFVPGPATQDRLRRPSHPTRRMTGGKFLSRQLIEAANAV